jgi:hypothetical protein
MATIFQSPGELLAAVGRTLGTTGWLEITQEGSISSPTRPATTSGSTSIPSAPSPALRDDDRARLSHARW